MPVYQYTVRDSTGASRTGSSTADNQETLEYHLRQQGFEISDVRQTKTRSSRFVPGEGRVRAEDLLAFWHQFAVLTRPDISLSHALRILVENSEGTSLKNILPFVQREIEAGRTLSTALRLHPRTFPPAVTGLIRAGEVANALDDAIARIIRLLEQDKGG